MSEAPQPSSEDSEASSPPSSAPSNGSQPSSGVSPSSAATFPLRTLADSPVDNDSADRFDYGDIADGLARLIDGEETATPLTIAVSAPWGAGKTSLLRLVENRVVRQKVDRREAPAVVVWFNAWMHDAAPNLSAALAADIARNATRCRDPWMRLWHPLPSSMLSPKERARRRFWLGVVALIVALVMYPFVSAWIRPSHGDITKVRAAFGASAVAWFALFWGISVLWPRVRQSLAAVAAFVDDPRSAAATGSMPEVSAQLGELIREAQEGMRRAFGADQPPRFVVIVDDLERCRPPKAVDVCEVAAQLLDHPGVITVLVGDLQVIAASAELKYQDTAAQFSKNADFSAESWGRFFLQKVVQFELELPPIPEERIRQLARSAPTTASVYGSGASSSIPMPDLSQRMVRSPEYMLILLVFGFLAFVPSIFFIMKQTADVGQSWTSMLPFFVMGGILGLEIVWAVIWAWRNYRRRRIFMLRTEVGRLVDNVISNELAQPGFPTASAELEKKLVDQLKTETAKYEKRHYWRHAQNLISPEEVHRRLQLRAASDEKTRGSAEKVILELLPSLPRTAKRLLNRLYFLLVVAYNRDLIAQNRVSAEQLGKWAALLDRWPLAGKAITKNPQLAKAFEDAAKQKDDFVTLCSAYSPPLASDPALLQAFFRTDPKLAAAAYHLVYLDADVRPPPPADPPRTGPAAGAEPPKAAAPADGAASVPKEAAFSDRETPEAVIVP